MKATVWTQTNCVFCEMAKDLLDEYGYEVEERNLGSANWTVEQLRESVPNATTVPQIFLDDEYVGGYDELHKRLLK